MNTSYAFCEIDEWIKECQRRGEPRIERKGLPIPSSRPATRFSDLVDDGVIRAIFEDQNAGSYSAALKLAASGDKEAHRTFRKILKAVAPAYLICHFGDDTAPKPRVHFLHRNLLELATSLDLSDLTTRVLWNSLMTSARAARDTRQMRSGSSESGPRDAGQSRKPIFTFRKDFSLSCSAFNRFTASNRQVAVQHPFGGDVSPPYTPCEAWQKNSNHHGTSGSTQPPAPPGRNRHAFG
jgi:hypothetical protein